MVGNTGAEHRAVRVERVEFSGENGIILRGLLHVPTTGPGPFPAASMAHGFAAPPFTDSCHMPSCSRKQD